jgi:hypothetical protein
MMKWEVAVAYLQYYPSTGLEGLKQQQKFLDNVDI